MTQNAAAMSFPALTPDQTQRRMSMLETFNFRAMTNAQLLAEQISRLRDVACSAQNPRITKANLIRIVVELERLATIAQADAELDSKCMDYAFHLSPDDLDEFEQLMGMAADTQIQH